MFVCFLFALIYGWHTKCKSYSEIVSAAVFLYRVYFAVGFFVRSVDASQIVVVVAAAAATAAATVAVVVSVVVVVAAAAAVVAAVVVTTLLVTTLL